MAEIVFGAATSHGPMLATPPEQWDQRAMADRSHRAHAYRGRTYTFDELAALRADAGLDAQITIQVWRERHAACQSAIAKLADAFHRTEPDVAVIIGNDQTEIFDTNVVPALSVFRGDVIPNGYPDAETIAAMPPGIPIALTGHIPLESAAYPGEPALAQHIIEAVVGDSFDVTTVQHLPDWARNVPHAFGFVYRNLMRDEAVPSVPVMLNTFYPPNQPRALRCHEFGRALARAIASWKSDARVAVIASGGLSHFVIDEELDRSLLDALLSGAMEPVLSLDEGYFQGGTSEIKSWIAQAGAMAKGGLRGTVVDYVPCYRSIAGTGSGMGFVSWSR